MKNTLQVALLTVATIAFTSSVGAQINIKKPKINIEKPKVNVGNNSGGSDSDNSIVPKNDPSGLFNNISSDPSADHHRKSAVEKLGLLETEFAKSPADYKEIESLITAIDKHIASVHKLEPNVKAEKFDERYNATKNPANADLAVITEMQKIEQTWHKDYSASAEFKNIDPFTYRVPQGYRETAPCYCREWDKTWSHTDYVALNNQYRELGKKVSKYTNPDAEKELVDIETCIANGDKYASQMATEGVKTHVTDFSAKEKALDPKGVIKRCDNFIASLDRIKTDPSLDLKPETVTALDNAKKETEKTKAESETYISSGEFQKHLDKIAAEKAKSVFLSKAATSNPGLEAGAMKYIKGEEYAAYLDRLDKSPVASTIKAVSTSNDYYVHKNDLGIPEYQYKEFEVAYKGTNGICYKATVYANYTYKGGGTYTNVANWGADSPIQMACENVK